jgi:hypothetical protein
MSQTMDPYNAKPPEMFPLPTPEDAYFCAAGNFRFGWAILKGRDASAFALWKGRLTGGWRVVREWPCTASGWIEARGFLTAEHPTMAQRLSELIDKNLDRRVSLQARVENEAALEREGRLGGLTRRSREI